MNKNINKNIELLSPAGSFECARAAVDAGADAVYMGGAKSSEEKGHKLFQRDFGGEVFVVTPKNGTVATEMEKRIKAYCEKLSKLPPKI